MENLYERVNKKVPRPILRTRVRFPAEIRLLSDFPPQASPLVHCGVSRWPRPRFALECLYLPPATPPKSILEQPVEVRERRHGAHAWSGLDRSVRVCGGDGVEAALLLGVETLPPGEGRASFSKPTYRPRLSIHQCVLLLLLFLTFSVLVANPKKLLYTVANPARGLLNREKRTKEKVWQHTPPHPHPPHCSFGENK